MLDRSNLHHYQERAIEFIQSTPKCALWVDMGMGKTATTLTAISDMLHIEISKVLIIAPLRVAHTVYTEEVSKWEHLNDLRVCKILGAVKERKLALHSKADIWVINRENVSWLVEHLGEKWDFDMLVIDESSSFKSPSSQRFKALRKIQPKINRMVQLTGTPSPNGYMDLWSQMYLLDGGKRLGRTITGYRSRFFASDFMNFRYTLRKDADVQIKEAIKDITFTLRAQDYLELPDVIPLLNHSPLEGALLKKYQKFEKDMVLSFENEDNVNAMSAATLSNKLLQFCSGFVYDEGGLAREIHTVKLDSLKELVEASGDENILLAYNFKHEKEMILKHIEGVVELDKKGEVIAKWNRGEIKVLLAHPSSAGHGLNLQKGGSIIVWFGFTWSLELYQQFNARLARQGQERPVKIIHLSCGEKEKELMSTISRKAVTQDDLLNTLRRL